MGLFQAFDIASSGLTAQRFRMDVIAENIANINSTHTEDGDVYRRKTVMFREKTLPTSFKSELNRALHFDGDGVKVTRVVEDYETDVILAYDPANPDADENGYVTYPNVDVVTEMTNLIDASRAYQANVTMFDALTAMAQQGISIGTS